MADVDANDYSRFDDVGKEDEAPAQENPAEADSDDELEVPEQVLRAEACKAEGNDLFRAGDNAGAQRKYEEGLSFIKPTDEGALKAGNDLSNLVGPLSAAKSVTLSLHLNMSACLNKQESWAASIRHASRALELEPGNFKALLRRGCARTRFGALDEGRTDLDHAAILEPENKSVKRELKVNAQLTARAKKKDKASFGNLFATSLYEDKEEERRRKARAAAERERRERRDYEAEKLDWAAKQAEAAAGSAADAAGATKAAKEEDADAADDAEAAGEISETAEAAAAPAEFPTFEKWREDKKKAKEAEEKKKKEAEEARKAEAQRKRDEERRQRREAREREEAERRKKKAERAAAGADATAAAPSEMRGYRRTADGKMTTYFNNELTDEAKQLIGDITPQRIDPTPAAPAAVASPERISPAPQQQQAVGSAWNAGGTWEERDMSSWAKDALKRHLEAATAEKKDALDMNNPEALMNALQGLTGGAAGSDLTGMLSLMQSVSVRMTNVKKVDGDASITVVRGTQRYLYDLVVEAEFEAVVTEKKPESVLANPNDPAAGTDGAKTKKYKGKLELPDLSSINDEEAEIRTSFKSKGPAAEHNKSVTEAVNNFKAAVLGAVAAFEAEFQSK